MYTLRPANLQWNKINKTQFFNLQIYKYTNSCYTPYVHNYSICVQTFSPTKASDVDVPTSLWAPKHSIHKGRQGSLNCLQLSIYCTWSIGSDIASLIKDGRLNFHYSTLSKLFLSSQYHYIYHNFSHNLCVLKPSQAARISVFIPSSCHRVSWLMINWQQLHVLWQQVNLLAPEFYI
jgi:hypothetical protein